jgi:hypothetical protein
VGVWLCTRLALGMAGVTDPGLLVEGAALGVVAAAVWLDARRRSEDLFLANLGIPAWTIAVLSLPIALVAELLVP